MNFLTFLGMAQYRSKLKNIFPLFKLFFFLVPWGEVDKRLVKEIVDFIRQEMSFDNNGQPKKVPCSSLILKRVKRYYRSQRHQCMIKSDQLKRRRQRLLNRRNRLTMVPFVYLAIDRMIFMLHYFLLDHIECRLINGISLKVLH